MSTEIFWNVIGSYNETTFKVQIGLVVILSVAVGIAYVGKLIYLPKIILGIINLYIGIVFFGIYGIEKIQTYFALPLYLIIGVLFLYEGIKNRKGNLKKPNLFQGGLLLLFIVYPLISVILGNNFPKMVTYIMPCPVISLSIVIYACYNIKNKLLLCLMTVWGLTGIKAFIVNAFEDIILLICGLYGVYLLYKSKK